MLQHFPRGYHVPADEYPWTGDKQMVSISGTVAAQETRHRQIFFMGVTLEDIRLANGTPLPAGVLQADTMYEV